MRTVAHVRLRNLNAVKPKPIDWHGLSWVAVGMSFVVALTLYAVTNA